MVTKKLKIKFKVKLFLSVALIFTIIALLVSWLFSSAAYKNARQNEENSMAIILERASSQVEALYEQMDIAATSITKNNTLKKIVLDLNTGTSQEGKAMEEFQTAKTIQTLLGNMMFSSTISNVLLYNREKGYFYYTGIYLGDQERVKTQLSQDHMGQYFEQTGRSRLCLPPHLSPWTPDSRAVLSVVRNFRDMSTTSQTIVEVQVPYSHLDNICQQDSFGSEKQLLILDQDLHVVYPYGPKPALLPQKDMDAIWHNLSSGVLSQFQSTYSYLAKPVLDGEYQVLLISNIRSILHYRRLNLFNTAVAVFMVLAAACIILFVVVTIISKPLKQLIDHINAISLDQDATLKLSNDSLDEFELINNSFNQMLDKLKESIQQTYEAQIRESNANFSALQAQINPHFLYNALNSISAASEVYGSEVTSKMCQQFSLMMRYITSGGSEAKLIDEVRHTRNYLDFMKLSYDGEFDYEIQLPLDLYNIKLPKLTLEPLAENCFKHGFKESLPPWHIRITCQAQAGQWIIQVEDNGAGFSQKALSQFQEFKAGYGFSQPPLCQELEIDGLGLKNIFGRLHLFFGHGFSFQIENCSDGPGCRITLKGDITYD